MKINTTYQDLNAMLLELQAFYSYDFPTVKRLVHSKTQRFYKENDYSIKYLQSKTQAIMEKYVEKNDAEEQEAKGIFKYQKQVVDFDGKPQELMMPVFKDDACAVSYKEEWDVLMKKTCTVEI